MKIKRISIKKYMINYIKYIEENKEKANQELIEQHLKKIKFFQAERLIHLIVTITSVIALVIAFTIGVAQENIYCIIIGYMVMCFSVPYIYHYFFLENAMWKMYEQYDEMIRTIRK